MDLIHPHTKNEVAEVVREAGERGHRLLVVGGREHVDKGNPTEVDAELWTTMLGRLVAYEPAEMVVVVEAGMRIGDLNRILAERGQEWPADAPDEATVGGVIAAAANSPRRLRTGPIRDTVLEVEVVTGDGRLVRGGGRTVKNVTGYDLPRLLTGSLGTLGAIVQAALKLRPLPKVRRTVIAHGDGLELGRRLLDAVPLPTAVLAHPDRVELRLEGWCGEVDEQADRARSVTTDLELEDDAPFPATPVTDPGAELVVEAAVSPSRIGQLVQATGLNWRALLGVGLVWVRLGDGNGDLAALRQRTHALGGIAPVIRGPGGLDDLPLPAIEVQRRLKHSFDPNGVLAPGRFWGGL